MDSESNIAWKWHDACRNNTCEVSSYTHCGLILMHFMDHFWIRNINTDAWTVHVQYDINSMTVCMQTHENSNNTMVTVTQRSLGSCRNKKLAVDSSFLLHTRYAWITACSGKPSVFSCYGACMYVSVQKVIHLNVMYMEHFHVTSHVQKWPPFCYTAAIQQWSYTAPLHSCRSKFSY